MSNDFKECIYATVWLFVGAFFGGLFMLSSMLGDVAELKVKNQELRSIITEYRIKDVNRSFTFVIADGCEDSSCITYGGKCKNSQNSIAVTDNGINLREECKNESKIKYKYLGNDMWYIDKDKI